jgi:NADH pyrophosphatase NudC (nudix superfamily)
MKKGTVCFILKDDKVLLVLIEYSPTDRKWTGIGGMVDEGESLEDTIIREAGEESFIEIDKSRLKKVAVLTSETFQLNAYIADKWSGEIKAKESSLKEFRWFSKYHLPFSEMHEGNENWLPQVLNGKLMKNNGNQIIEVKTLD